MKEEYVLFLDRIGRMLLATVVDKADDTLSVRTPVVVTVEEKMDNSGVMIKLHPFLYNGIVKNAVRSIFSFKKSDITMIRTQLHDDFLLKYKALEQAINKQ